LGIETLEASDAMPERLRDAKQRLVRRPLDDDLGAATASVEQARARRPIGEAGATGNRGHVSGGQAGAGGGGLAHRRVDVLDRKRRDKIPGLQPKQRDRTGVDSTAREVDPCFWQRLGPRDVRQVRKSHGHGRRCDTSAGSALWRRKNATEATPRIADPISDWVGYVMKLLATMPMATAMNNAVVHGCPGTAATPGGGAVSRCLRRINPPAVNPKNNQSAKTTYDNS